MPTRFNIGGCKTNIGDVEFDFNVDHITFANVQVGYF